MGDERGVDAVGEAALLAHLLVEPRGEGAAAQDRVEHERRHEVLVAARHGGQAEAHHRLRHVHVDDLELLGGLRLGLGDGRERGLGRQRAEHGVEHAAQRRRVDVADHHHAQRRPWRRRARGSRRGPRALCRPPTWACRWPAGRRDGRRRPAPSTARWRPGWDRARRTRGSPDAACACARWPRRRSAACRSRAPAVGRRRRGSRSGSRSCRRRRRAPSSKLMRMASSSMRSWNALASRSPAPSSSMLARKFARPSRPSGSWALPPPSKAKRMAISGTSWRLDQPGGDAPGALDLLDLHGLRLAGEE